MAVEVTTNDGPGGRVRRYILGGPDDPDVKRRKWPPPLLLADGTPDHDMLDAMAEVDALTPACPPISPGIRNQMGPWPEPPAPRAEKPEPPPCRVGRG